MTTVKIGERDITLKPYTRSVARQVQEKLLEGVVVGGDTVNQKMEMPAINNEKSEQLLVVLMSGLTNEEVDALLDEDYATLKLAINEEIKGKKKGK